MSALSVWRSLYKYAVRNIIYTLLLCTAFTTVNLFINVLFTSSNLQKYFVSLHNEAKIDETSTNALIDPVQIAVSSLIPPIAVIIPLCVLMLPFINYVFCIGRGYETGVLRALGLSKGKIWKRLISEYIILVCFAVVTAQYITFLMYKDFVNSLLPIGNMEKTLLAAIRDVDNLHKYLSVDYRALVFLSVLAFAVTLITAVLQIAVITKNEPMKLIRTYK